MLKEIWKEIEDCTEYEVSNFGRVRSVERTVLDSLGRKRIIKSTILKPFISKGYAIVTLSKNNTKKHYPIHRLVATAFLPNKENFPIINHKDENKQNNQVENLEWCTIKYNMNYGECRNKTIKGIIKSVIQLDINNNYIRTFSSATEAQKELGIKQNSICLCCKGKYKTAGGYKWKYNN